ncbi:alpha/beta fold hydrolase, partial [Mycobacterium paraintracellulare]|uniref:alpha/beta fold hydrolase n=1 Tax=Mycobacterium paraintracellulare TaxID=1138383 RepID=UPI001916C4F2
RGIGATVSATIVCVEKPSAFSVALIEGLNAAPARIVGMSMGAFITQELMLARPDLVSAAVLMGTRGRM